MTICIAALSDNGNGCVLTSDQMVTAHFPIGYEFENEEVEKIVKISDSAYILISGDILFANEIINEANKKIMAENITAIDGIAETLRSAYQTYRNIYITRKELEPRGLSLVFYYNNHQRLQPQIVQMIDAEFANFNTGVSFIVVGKNESLFHIYTVSNPGQLFSHNCIGYAAIGTGAPHATYSLIEANYKKSLNKEKVRELVEKAKIRSEVAPGVGSKTKKVEL